MGEGRKVAIKISGFVSEGALEALRGLLANEDVVIEESVLKISPAQEALLRQLVAAEGYVDTNVLSEATGLIGPTIRPALSRLADVRLVERNRDILQGPALWRATPEGRRWVEERGEGR